MKVHKQNETKMGNKPINGGINKTVLPLKMVRYIVFYGTKRHNIFLFYTVYYINFSTNQLLARLAECAINQASTNAIN